MATATLVSSDIEIGRRILAALARAGIPVTVSIWAFVPQVEEWQFVIATPLVDKKGPLAAYGEINRVLQKEGVFDEIPVRPIFLKSPSDRVLKSLEKQSRSVPREAFRVLNEPIAGDFVEDAYLYTGFIHVAQLPTLPASGPPLYSVIYAPYEGGGAVPGVELEGVEGLRAFLTDRLHIDSWSVESALRDLGENRSTSIPNVRIHPQELKRHRLV